MIHNNKRINTLSINLSNLSKMLACPAAVEPRLSRGKTKRSPLAGSSGHRYLSSWKAYVCCWIGCTIDFDDDDTLCQLILIPHDSLVACAPSWTHGPWTSPQLIAVEIPASLPLERERVLSYHMDKWIWGWRVWRQKRNYIHTIRWSVGPKRRPFGVLFGPRWKKPHALRRSMEYSPATLLDR